MIDTSSVARFLIWAVVAVAIGTATGLVLGWLGLDGSTWGLVPIVVGIVAGFTLIPHGPRSRA
jgi:hypothetical protein